MQDTRYDLTRLTLAILFIALLIGISLWIVRPFLPAIIWAMTLVVATWPIMRGLQARLWNRRSLAVAVMTIVLLLLFVVPFWFAIGIIVRNTGQIVTWAESIATMEFPPPSDWFHMSRRKRRLACRRHRGLHRRGSYRWSAPGARSC